MATANICDICGKVISDCQRNRNFKVKELVSFFSYDGWKSNHWVNIDVHEECLDKLLQAADNLGEQQNESNN